MARLSRRQSSLRHAIVHVPPFIVVVGVLLSGQPGRAEISIGALLVDGQCLLGLALDSNQTRMVSNNGAMLDARLKGLLAGGICNTNVYEFNCSPAFLCRSPATP